jgi:hypothetical protein
MKLKVTNVSDNDITRLNFTFQPHETIEVEVQTAYERLAISAARFLEVEDVIDAPVKVSKKKAAPEVVEEVEVSGGAEVAKEVE